MAERVLSNIAAGILSSLAAPLATEEIRLLLGAKDELEKLEDTVSTIRAVLVDAEERQSKSHAVNLWLEKLSVVLHDADDLLDAASTEARQQEIMTQDTKADKVRVIFSKSKQLAFRLKMGHKIKRIRERLDAIAADIKNFQFGEHLMETPIGVIGRENTYSFVPEQHVVGRENDKEAVIESLLNTNIKENVSVLPIVGIGGLGKTTLAQLVFNDERIQMNFDLKMWVCVSDNFDVKIIVEKILESASRKRPEKLEMDTLVHCLRKEIVIQKFFLVLDDVWNEDSEKWLELKSLFTDGVKGTKILITTRSDEVARITHTIKPHILRGLGEESSWVLFKNMAFKNGQELENLSIIEIGKEIVKKCVGVPLVVRTTGRMLSGKDSVKEWLAFRDIQILRITQSNETTILSTLKLSYDVLPSHLKHCFVYCSLFPKNYEFDESMLIKLWIAQGFVVSQQNRCLEDIGHDYFMELVSRLFFQKFVNYFWDKEDEIVFKMHDLMHDLAISMSGSLITTTFDNKGEDVKKTRHISVCDGHNFSSLYKLSKIRTLIHFQGQMIVEKIISSFKFLRVLVLMDRNIKFVPSNISNLKHLRYLDLSYNRKFEELPNSITRLVNLQTLILSRCESLKKLPKDINKLVNLKHLHNDGCDLLCMSHELSQLTNLQTLKLFVVNPHSPSEHKVGFEVLSGLKNLKGNLKLRDWNNRIEGKASESNKAVDLKSAFNILELKGFLYHGILLQNSFDHQGSRPFSYLSTFTSLVELRIFAVVCKYLPPLGQLPLLEKVSLEMLGDLEYILGYDDNNQCSFSTKPVICFPSLKSLKILCCPNLKGWLWGDSPVEAEHHLPPIFSGLLELIISECPVLTSMPIFPNISDLLCLKYASWKPLQLTLMLNSSAVTSSSAHVASSLNPLSKLKCLELASVLDLETLSMEGLQYLTSLEILEISNLDKLKSLCLRELQHFTALKKLYLYNCPELEFVNNEDMVQLQGLKRLLSIHFIKLPKLMALPLVFQKLNTIQKIYLKDCESLTTLPSWICNYKSLEELEIVGCSSLTSLPEGMGRLLSLKRLQIEDCPITLQGFGGETGLELTNDEDGVQWQSLENIFYISLVKLSKLVSLPLEFQHYTTLQKLDIKNCESLIALPEWIYSFKSLEELKIIRCSNFRSLPKGMGRFTSLKILTIVDCPIKLQSFEEATELELTNDEDGRQWQGPKNLLSIHFERLHEMVSFPLWLHHATALQNLYIDSCNSLTTIPEWICDYKSLEVLEIVDCSSLTSLPEGVESLPSLERISTDGCHMLKRIQRPLGRNISRRNKSILPRIYWD